MVFQSSCGWYEVNNSGRWYKTNNPYTSFACMQCTWCTRFFLGRCYSSTKGKTAQPQRFCGLSCRGKFIGNRDKAVHLKPYGFQKGQTPHNFVGHTIHSSGYTVLSGGGVRQLEHRKVMETVLGRALLPTEVVHHINHDKTDNRPENLQVFASQGEHLYHHLKEKYGE